MRRTVIIVVAVVLSVFGVGIAAFFYYEPKLAAITSIAAFVSRNTLRRIVSRISWVAILIILPTRHRRRYRKYSKLFMDELHELWTDVTAKSWAIWREKPWWVRLLLLCTLPFFLFVALVAAVALNTLAYLTPMARTPSSFAGVWFRSSAMPYLVRTAAGRWIEDVIPEQWKKIPERYRKPARRIIIWLWFRTVGTLMRRGILVGRHGLDDAAERYAQYLHTMKQNGGYY